MTGGKDSRAVLAGLVGASAADSVHATIMARPDHPDATVAARLTRHYGIPFENRGIEYLLEGTLLERIARHLWRTEGLLHAWDLKPFAPRDGEVILTGQVGESYRGHFTRNLLRPWRCVRRGYTDESFVDQHDLLRPVARAFVHGRLTTWFDAARADGMRQSDVRDRWHRECRMWQWASNILRGDALGGMACAPLASGRLLAMYQRKLSLRDRIHKRIHFELT